MSYQWVRLPDETYETPRGDTGHRPVGLAPRDVEWVGNRLADGSWVVCVRPASQTPSIAERLSPVEAHAAFAAAADAVDGLPAAGWTAGENPFID